MSRNVTENVTNISQLDNKHSYNTSCYEKCVTIRILIRMLGSDIEVISIHGIYQPANTMAHLTQKIFKMFRAQKYI